MAFLEYEAIRTRVN